MAKSKAKIKKKVVKKPKTAKPTAKKATKKPLKKMAAPVRTGKGGKEDKVAMLIHLGKERGYITFDDVLREFPTIEDDILLLE